MVFTQKGFDFATHVERRHEHSHEENKILIIGKTINNYTVDSARDSKIYEQSMKNGKTHRKIEHVSILKLNNSVMKI